MIDEDANEEWSDKDIIIALVGPTNSGKSTFVEKAVGIEGISRGTFGSGTTKISVIKFPFPGLFNASICLVDTPGLDKFDTRKGVYNVSEMISDWLNNVYHKESGLAGLLFFHRVSDTHMLTLSSAKWKCLQRLCEDELNRLTLATTMWDDVSEGRGTFYEDDLRRTLKPQIDEGLLLKRFLNNPDSAFDILRPIIQATSYRQSTLGRVLFRGQFLASTAVKTIQRDEPPIIVLIGPYRSGKRRFIDSLVLDTSWAYQDLRNTVCSVMIKLLNGKGSVLFVDTPHFHNYTKGAEDSLENVWLWLINQKATNIAGILCFQDITDNRWIKPPPRLLLEQLLGAKALSKLILVITYFNLKKVSEAIEGEEDLQSRWAAYVKSGARMERFGNDTETAWRIVESLL